MIHTPITQHTRICFRQLSTLSTSRSMKGKVILIDNLDTLQGREYIVTDFTAILFCTQGNLELTLNGSHYYIGTGDMLYCPKDTGLCHIRLHPDCRGRFLCISEEYAGKIFTHVMCQWNCILQTRQNPLLHLEEGELELLNAYYRLFAVKVQHAGDMPEHDADYILRGFFHDFHHILLRHASPHTGQRPCICTSQRQNELFKQFIVLLQQHFHREHFCCFYADRLCVTPKYLTTVVKRVSGRSVSKWIDSYLMDEIRSQLRNTPYTIAEIADRLSFSNHSFFGKFVKAHTGMSPVSLRKMLQAPPEPSSGQP